MGSCFWPSTFLFSDSSFKAGARESVNAQLKVDIPRLRSPCECEHNNPDSLDARLFPSVVLAVAPAVTMDEASSLSIDRMNLIDLLLGVGSYSLGSYFCPSIFLFRCPTQRPERASRLTLSSRSTSHAFVWIEFIVFMSY